MVFLLLVRSPKKQNTIPADVLPSDSKALFSSLIYPALKKTLVTRTETRQLH